MPDADMLIRIATLFGVSVSCLLDRKVEDLSSGDLSEELAQLHEQLAQKNQKEKLLLQANKKRRLLLFFSFLSMLVMLHVKNEMLSVLLTGFCALVTVIVLYRNLALLTSVTTKDLRLGVLRITTFFNIAVLAVGMAVALLLALNPSSFCEKNEKQIAMAVVFCVILFAGFVSPKLPYTYHTGLRLPWTVQDEDTWNVAHRIMGVISFPIGLFYIACAYTIPNFEGVTLCTLGVWIGIPGIVSLAFWWNKYHGKL